MTASILVIEDEVNIRHFIAANFRVRGYEVIEAGDAETGLAIIQRSAIDIVLLDVRLPGMSGLDLLDTFDSRLHNLPIILLSAYLLSLSEIQSQHPNVRYVLSKPLDVRLLLVTVKNILDGNAPDNPHDFRA